MQDTSTVNRFGFYAALFTAVTGVVAFGLGIMAVPVAGANCPSNCVPYPYMGTAGQWPKDFLWQPPAILLMLGYLALMLSVHSAVPVSRRIISLAALCLALVSATVLAIDYYVQFSVVPVSLQANETDGLPLLIQYNPHGLFIALEEFGYLAMSLSFVLIASALALGGRLEAGIRWVFRTAFVVSVVALAAFWLAYGIDRKDRFEIVILSACWMALIVNGVLLGIFFRRRLRVELPAGSSDDRSGRIGTQAGTADR
jgi:hypothetical protein